MSNRLYTAAVVVGWLAAMTWLITDRILPPFFNGDAPATRPSNQIEPVAWRIEMEGRPCGLAVMQAVASHGGTKEVHSYLQVERIEAPKAAPVWLTPVIKSFQSLSFTMRTRTTYDMVDRLYAFDTKLTIGKPDTLVFVKGKVSKERLQITVRVGDLIRRRFEYPWPQNGTLGTDLTPNGRLLPLYEGRRWTSEVYSPFASPGNPLEMIEAEVTEPLRYTDGSELKKAWRVEFRSLEKTGSTEEGRLRASLCVAEDGRVLRQEAFFLGSSIVFERCSDEESAELAAGHLQLAKYATTYDTLSGRDRAEPSPLGDGTAISPPGTTPSDSPATGSTSN